MKRERLSTEAYIPTLLALVGAVSVSMYAHAIEVSTTDFDQDGAPDVVVENPYLKIVVGARGGKIISLYDKHRIREVVKTFGHNGGT